jgi:hypothetical protein
MKPRTSALGRSGQADRLLTLPQKNDNSFVKNRNRAIMPQCAD